MTHNGCCILLRCQEKCWNLFWWTWIKKWWFNRLIAGYCFLIISHFESCCIITWTVTWLYICEKDLLLTTPCSYNNALYIYNAIDDNSMDMALGHVTYWIKKIYAHWLLIIWVWMPGFFWQWISCYNSRGQQNLHHTSQLLWHDGCVVTYTISWPPRHTFIARVSWT